MFKGIKAKFAERKHNIAVLHRLLDRHADMTATALCDKYIPDESRCDIVNTLGCEAKALIAAIVAYETQSYWSVAYPMIAVAAFIFGILM